jgi:hypothetical protein
MFPVVVTPSELRHKLSFFLSKVLNGPIFIKNRNGNQVILSEEDYEYMSSFVPGNVFNADRDNKGRGVPVDDFVSALKNA